MFKRLVFFLCFFISTGLGATPSDKISIVEDNTLKIENIFLKGEALYPYDSVIKLSHNVISQRASYSNNIIAQSFILLANIADHKGENASAFQFSSDGLMLSGIRLDLKLDLLLKITKGYYKQAQFNEVLKYADRVLKLAYEMPQTESRIIALSYKVMALSSLGEYQKAVTILNKIELLIAKNQFSQNINVLEILADTYLFQQDYSTAIALYNKVIKLRFGLAQVTNLGQTYLNIAKAYKQLNKFDDAYNAYWQCKEHAEKYQTPIYVALANLGLGQVLSIQAKSAQSYMLLLEASKTLNTEQLTGPYIDALIALSISSRDLNELKESYKWLKSAEKIAENYVLSSTQIQLYDLLSTMYYEQGLYKLSYLYQKKYIDSYKNFKAYSTLLPIMSDYPNSAAIHNRELAMKISEESELSVNYSLKLKEQKVVIFVLSVVLLLIICILCVLGFRRAKKIDQFEQRVNTNDQKELATPAYTKHLYQLMFKMARKYNYPLTVSYIVIENWSELEFHFDKKTVKDIDKTISTLLQEYISEFDHAGKINEGEYILMCPHQSNDSILGNLDKLAETLRVRFFANIGYFSVKIKYSCDMPTIQDIDPYLFLSRLSENSLKNT